MNEQERAQLDAAVELAACVERLLDARTMSEERGIAKLLAERLKQYRNALEASK